METLSDVLSPFIERGELAGAVVLAADRERVLATEALGLADIASARPMQTDALFWIASQTKPMTATALMMLVDEGRLSLDDPVTKYLPAFEGQRIIEEHEGGGATLRPLPRPLTVRHLLSHTSGLPFVLPLEVSAPDVLTPEQAALCYSTLPLGFEPGTGYLYSNIGINIAARILEIVAGQPYAELMDERLFGPLGMSDTTFWPSEEQASRLAKSYRKGEGGAWEEIPIWALRLPLSERARQPIPAGGLFSTASDVALFCRMILSGGELDGRRYLSPAALAEMTTRQTAPGLESHGLGWAVGEASFGHGGAYSTIMTIHPAQNLATVFLVQLAGEAGPAREAFAQAALEKFGTHEPASTCSA